MNNTTYHQAQPWPDYLTFTFSVSSANSKAALHYAAGLTQLGWSMQKMLITLSTP